MRSEAQTEIMLPIATALSVNAMRRSVAGALADHPVVPSAVHRDGPPRAAEPPRTGLPVPAHDARTAGIPWGHDRAAA
jgi:hypothetical protein